MYKTHVKKLKSSICNTFFFQGSDYKSLDFNEMKYEYQFKDEKERKYVEAFLLQRKCLFKNEDEFIQARDFIVRALENDEIPDELVQYKSLKTEYEAFTQEAKEGFRLRKKIETQKQRLETFSVDQVIGAAGAGKTRLGKDAGELLHSEKAISQQPLVLQAKVMMTEQGVKEWLLEKGWIENGGVLIIDEANIVKDTHVWDFLSACIYEDRGIMINGEFYRLDNHVVEITGNTADYGGRRGINVGTKKILRSQGQFKLAILGKVVRRLFDSEPEDAKLEKIQVIGDLYETLKGFPAKESIEISLRDINVILWRAYRYCDGQAKDPESAPVTQEYFKQACDQAIYDFYEDQLILPTSEHPIALPDFESFFDSLKVKGEQRTPPVYIVESDKACAKELYMMLTEQGGSIQKSGALLSKNGLIITGEAGRGKDKLVELM